MHLDHALGDVDDPILTHVRQRLERCLDQPILTQRRGCNLDDKKRLVGVNQVVVAERNDRDVGLRLGLVRREEGLLDSNAGAPQ